MLPADGPRKAELCNLIWEVGGYLGRVEAEAVYDALREALAAAPLVGEMDGDVVQRGADAILRLRETHPGIDTQGLIACDRRTVAAAVLAVLPSPVVGPTITDDLLERLALAAFAGVGDDHGGLSMRDALREMRAVLDVKSSPGDDPDHPSGEQGTGKPGGGPLRAAGPTPIVTDAAWIGRIYNLVVDHEQSYTGSCSRREFYREGREKLAAALAAAPVGVSSSDEPEGDGDLRERIAAVAGAAHREHQQRGWTHPLLTASPSVRLARWLDADPIRAPHIYGGDWLGWVVTLTRGGKFCASKTGATRDDAITAALDQAEAATPEGGSDVES